MNVAEREFVGTVKSVSVTKIVSVPLPVAEIAETILSSGPFTPEAERLLILKLPKLPEKFSVVLEASDACCAPSTEMTIEALAGVLIAPAINAAATTARSEEHT